MKFSIFQLLITFQDLERIAQITGLSKRVTQVWFQNSRARHKKNTTGGNEKRELSATFIFYLLRKFAKLKQNVLVFNERVFIFPYLGFPNGKNTIGSKLPRDWRSWLLTNFCLFFHLVRTKFFCPNVDQFFFWLYHIVHHFILFFLNYCL